jgi:hypothetical protein
MQEFIHICPVGAAVPFIIHPDSGTNSRMEWVMDRSGAPLARELLLIKVDEKHFAAILDGSRELHPEPLWCVPIAESSLTSDTGASEIFFGLLIHAHKCAKRVPAYCR